MSNRRLRTWTRWAVLIGGVLGCLVAALGAVTHDWPPGATDDEAPPPGAAETTPADRRSAFDTVVAADRPTAHLRGTLDLVTGRRIGREVGRPGLARMPDGAVVPLFSGRDEHVFFPDRAQYSIPETGQLSVECWLRPDLLQFPDEEGSGYVYVLGKGDPGHQEWFVRMYSERNDEGRPSRISGYAFNPKGGQGAGAYVQDPVTPGQWIQLVLVFDRRSAPGAPTGTVTLYKDGVWRDSDALASYDVDPVNGPAPLRVGTGYRRSHFAGAIGDVVFFDRALAPGRIRAHYRALWAAEGP